MKKRRLLLIPIILLPLLYLTIRSFVFIASTENVPLPANHQALLKGESQLFKHMGSTSMQGFHPYTVFLVGDSYGLLIIEKKVKSGSSPLENLSIANACGSGYSSSTVGSIFRDDLRYAYVNKEPIERINLCMDNFKEEYIKRESENLLYLDFVPTGNFGLKLKEYTTFELTTKKNPYFEETSNQFAIYRKGESIFFLYLKPIYEEVKVDLKLSDIIDFD
jgi:hypothetical protein